MDNEKELGLIPKYAVRRLNDLEGKHNKCAFFVLDPVHDKSARSALIHYAAHVRLNGYEVLYNDLMNWVTEIEADNG